MRQERAERTRRSLTRAAAQLFDRLGYERATLSGVSDLAAVSKGALSFHFATKAELADAIQLEACAASRAAMDRLARRDVPALQTLVDMTHLAAEQIARDERTRASLRLTRERGTACDPAMHSFTNWLQVFQDCARRARSDRSLREGPDPYTVATLALVLVCGAQPHQHEANVEIHQWLTGLWRLLLTALKRPESPWRFRPEGTMTDWAPVARDPEEPAPTGVPIPRG